MDQQEVYRRHHSTVISHMSTSTLCVCDIDRLMSGGGGEGYVCMGGGESVCVCVGYVYV